MLYSIDFSPTGGSRRVLDMVTGAWDSDKTAIDLCETQEDFSRFGFSPDDLCFVAVPSYGGRVPAVAAERLGLLSGNGARAVLVCAYGNRAYEDTLRELEDVLMGRGFRCAAAIAAVAEHSIVRQIAAGRPDARDCEELAGFAQRIRDKLGAGECPTVNVPGNYPYRDYGGVSMKPYASDACTQCGLCAKQCPVRAIVPQNLRVSGEGCILCMRCIAICPQNARQVDKVKLAAVEQMLKKVCEARRENELFL